MKWPFQLNPRYAKNVIRNATAKRYITFASIATTELPHIGRNKTYSSPIHSHHVFQSAVIRSNDLLVNRAAMGRARFIIYPWFICFFSSFCLRPGADRCSAILKIGVNHATCHVYSLKSVERLINVQCYEYVIIFSFRFTRFYSRWKEYQMRKKGIKSAMEFSDTAAFSFATWETWLDSVYFGRSDSLFSSLCIFCNFRQPSANLKSRNL